MCARRVSMPAWLWRAAHCVSLSELLPERVSPELHDLQVKLAAQLPYRQAAAILRQLLPETGGLNHATTRNRTLAVGRRIEQEICDEVDNPQVVPEPAQQMVVGIDGAFARAANTQPGQRHQFEILTGREETTHRTGEAFAVVRNVEISERSKKCKLFCAAMVEDVERSIAFFSLLQREIRCLVLRTASHGLMSRSSAHRTRAPLPLSWHRLLAFRSQPSFGRPESITFQMAVVLSYHILWYLNIENTPYGGLEFFYALLVSITFYEQICFSDRTSP